MTKSTNNSKERMRVYRAKRRQSESPEKRKQRLSRDRERKRLKRSTESSERNQQRLSRQRQRQHELRATQAANESPVEKQQRLLRLQQRRRELRATQAASESPADRQQRLLSEQQRLHRFRSTQRANNSTETSNIDIVNDLLDDMSIKNASDEALQYLHRTRVYDSKDKHLAIVCIVCDCFILGTETIKNITDYQLEQHRQRFSVDCYKKIYNMSTDVNGQRDPLYSLWKYYEVPNHEGMLLSPRAKRTGNNTWSCCEGCYRALAHNRRDKPPPRMAIANGFAIGEINVEGVNIDSDVNDVTRALLSPVRTHGYVMAFSGGAHKSIQGHYQFFELDQQRVHGAIHHLRSIENCSHIYVLFAGRMTPAQKRRVRKECMVDTEIYNKLAIWFTRHSGHPGFTDVKIPEECPQPIIIENTETENNTDHSINPSVENNFTGGSYFFSTGQDPEPSSSTYGTNKAFTLAMLKDEKPTLMVYGGDYKRSLELNVEDLLPFAFPYGMGGPKQNRPTKVSFESCIQRYARLASREFMRGDAVLVLHHMYARQLSFKSGVITCRSNIGGTTMGERFANLSASQLQSMLEKKETDLDTETRQLIKGISTSCRSLGYTPEAAKHARRNGFAYQDYFGLNSVFVTISPCDECSFRVRLFANPGEKVSTSNEILIKTKSHHY